MQFNSFSVHLDTKNLSTREIEGFFTVGGTEKGQSGRYSTRKWSLNLLIISYHFVSIQSG